MKEILGIAMAMQERPLQPMYYTTYSMYNIYKRHTPNDPSSGT